MPLADKFTPRVPKVLTVDIETAPAIAMVWGLWDQNIAPSQIVEPSRVLCFAAKWFHEKRVLFGSEFHDGRREFLELAWRLFDEADCVVTYNGVKFDIPHLQREWMLLGLGPPSPWVDVDLLRVFRSRAKFMSNKLGFITESLGLDSKLETGGQQLWTDVLAGDEKAWGKFKRYNVNDVRITEQLFVQVKSWVKGPHFGLLAGNPAACHSCGSVDLVPAGFVYSRVERYPKLVCGCGAWSRLLRSGVTRPA